MKRLYFIIICFLMILSISVIYDVTLYESVYYELVSIQDTVCYLVSKNGGVTFSIKEMLNEKNINIGYEKSSDINGAAFEFSLSKKIVYFLTFDEKYVKIDLIVILGY